jgi:hypothetical protein
MTLGTRALGVVRRMRVNAKARCVLCGCVSLVPLPFSFNVALCLQLINTLTVCNLSQSNFSPNTTDKELCSHSAWDPNELVLEERPSSRLFKEVTLPLLPSLFVKLSIGEALLVPPDLDPCE